MSINFSGINSDEGSILNLTDRSVVSLFIFSFVFFPFGSRDAGKSMKRRRHDFASSHNRKQIFHHFFSSAAAFQIIVSVHSRCDAMLKPRLAVYDKVQKSGFFHSSRTQTTTLYNPKPLLWMGIRTRQQERLDERRIRGAKKAFESSILMIYTKLGVNSQRFWFNSTARTRMENNSSLFNPLRLHKRTRVEVENEIVRTENCFIHEMSSLPSWFWRESYEKTE